MIANGDIRHSDHDVILSTETFPPPQEPEALGANQRGVTSMQNFEWV